MILNKRHGSGNWPRVVPLLQIFGGFNMFTHIFMWKDYCTQNFLVFFSFVDTYGLHNVQSGQLIDWPWHSDDHGVWVSVPPVKVFLNCRNFTTLACCKLRMQSFLEQNECQWSKAKITGSSHLTKPYRAQITGCIHIFLFHYKEQSTVVDENPISQSQLLLNLIVRMGN